jgi:hypothetical protein
MTPLIIAFGHKARNGKDTAGEAVIRYYRGKQQLASSFGLSRAKLQHSLKTFPNAGLYKFATALYQEVEDAIGDHDGDVEKLLREGFDDLVSGTHILIPQHVQPTLPAKPEPMAKYGKHGQLLQWWGTDFRRKQDKNYWVEKTFASIPSSIDIACITDMRFLNEAWAVQERGGFTVNVVRKNKDGSRYITGDRPANHPSEIDLDDYNFDFEITAHSGEVPWVEQQAINLAEYLRALKG